MSLWGCLQGLCKDIGVSNFGIGHLEQLLKRAKVAPAVNQIELSPFLQRQELVDYCRNKNIALEVHIAYCLLLQLCPELPSMNSHACMSANVPHMML